MGRRKPQKFLKISSSSGDTFRDTYTQTVAKILLKSRDTFEEIVFIVHII